MGTEVIKVHVPARSKSPKVDKHRQLSSLHPSPLQRAWIGASPTTNKDSLQVPSENSHFTEMTRIGNGARCSYVKALSFTKSATVPELTRANINDSPVIKALPMPPAITSSPASPKRKCLLAAMITLSQSVQSEERYCFLCSDVFFIAKQKTRSGLRLKEQIPLNEMWVSSSVANISAAATSVDCKSSFAIGWPMTNLIATFPNSKHCEMWYSRLTRQIEIERSNHSVQSTAIKIHHADKKFVPPIVELTVSIGEDVNSVVSRCCTKWSLESETMKLWAVISGRSYLLNGHEIPFAIKMSYSKSGNHSKTRSDNFKETANNDHEDSSSCKFILRPVHKADSVEQTGWQRLLRKPILSIKLKRESKKLSHGLFGRPLTDVCEENRLPKSLMIILKKLFNEGLYMVGVMRKAANKRRIQECRGKLDSGDEIDIDSPVLAAALLKDYLRNLPECLLMSDLYDSWLDTMKIEDHPARLSKIKELYCKLPLSNQLLLAYIFCILYHMSQNSDNNKMTPYNLAVCISMCLLWNENISTEESVRSAMFIQFLIERTIDVFGEECIHLMGDPPANDEMGGDDMLSAVDTGQERSSVFSSADSLDSPIADTDRLPQSVDSGCFSSIDGDSQVLSPCSISLVECEVSGHVMLTPRSQSFNDELSGPHDLHLDASSDVNRTVDLISSSLTDSTKEVYNNSQVSSENETLTENNLTAFSYFISESELDGSEIIEQKAKRKPANCTSLSKEVQFSASNRIDFENEVVISSDNVTEYESDVIRSRDEQYFHKIQNSVILEKLNESGENVRNAMNLETSISNATEKQNLPLKALQWYANSTKRSLNSQCNVTNVGDTCHELSTDSYNKRVGGNNEHVVSTFNNGAIQQTATKSYVNQPCVVVSPPTSENKFKMSSRIQSLANRTSDIHTKCQSTTTNGELFQNVSVTPTYSSPINKDNLSRGFTPYNNELTMHENPMTKKHENITYSEVKKSLSVQHNNRNKNGSNVTHSIIDSKISSNSYAIQQPVLQDMDKSDEDLYHVRGVVDSKGTGLQLSSIRKVNSVSVDDKNNVHRNPPLANDNTVQPHVRNKDHATVVPPPYFNHCLPAAPPPYVEAVWRANQLKCGRNPEVDSPRMSPNLLSKLQNEPYAFGDQNSNYSVDLVNLKSKRGPYTYTNYHQQQSPRALEPLHSTIIGDEWTESQSEKRSYGKKPQQRRPKSVHMTSIAQDVGQQHVTSLPVYPEGFWVTRLEHTTDNEGSRQDILPYNNFDPFCSTNMHAQYYSNNRLPSNDMQGIYYPNKNEFHGSLLTAQKF